MWIYGSSMSMETAITSKHYASCAADLRFVSVTMTNLHRFYPKILLKMELFTFTLQSFIGKLSLESE